MRSSSSSRLRRLAFSSLVFLFNDFSRATSALIRGPRAIRASSGVSSGRSPRDSSLSGVSWSLVGELEGGRQLARSDSRRPIGRSDRVSLNPPKSKYADKSDSRPGRPSRQTSWSLHLGEYTSDLSGSSPLLRKPKPPMDSLNLPDKIEAGFVQIATARCISNEATLPMPRFASDQLVEYFIRGRLVHASASRARGLAA
jgi:hypothetical protein